MKTDKEIIRSTIYLICICAILIAGIKLYYLYKQQVKEKQIEEMKKEKTIQKPKIKKKIIKPKEYEFKISIDKLTFKINNDLIKWAYINSSPQVPKSLVIDILKECQKYDNGLLLLIIAMTETSLTPWKNNYDKYYTLLVKKIRKLKLTKRQISEYKKLAVGLCQIKPYFWFEKFKKKGIIQDLRDFYDYKKSIKMAHEILNQYHNELKDWKKVLIKYTGSRKNADKVLSLYGYLILEKDLKIIKK